MAADPEALRVLALLPVAGQPRHAKRIDVLLGMGCRVHAGLFRRERERGRMPRCEITELGHIADYRYVSRLGALWRARTAVRELAACADVVYAFGPDMALLAIVASDKPVVMEIGDIVALQVRRDLIGGAYRRLDRWIARRCGLIVTTTPKFLSEYYGRWLGISTPGLVLENKVEAVWAASVRGGGVPPRRDRRPGDPIRIGYFGLLGCQWALDTLHALLVGHPGRFEVVLAGKEWPGADLKRFLETTPGTRSLGPYRSPDDLPGLYGSIDVTWACYPPIQAQDWNLRWARPNRFYESCLFGAPLISRAGSSDAEDVAKWDLGLIVDEVDPGRAAELLASRISDDSLVTWGRSMRQLPPEVYSYTDEFDRLIARMRGLAVGGRRS